MFSNETLYFLSLPYVFMSVYPRLQPCPVLKKKIVRTK
jgi:hypothetical protein